MHPNFMHNVMNTEMTNLNFHSQMAYCLMSKTSETTLKVEPTYLKWWVSLRFG